MARVLCVFDEIFSLYFSFRVKILVFESTGICVRALNLRFSLRSRFLREKKETGRIAEGDFA